MTQSVIQCRLLLNTTFTIPSRISLVSCHLTNQRRVLRCHVTSSPPITAHLLSFSTVFCSPSLVWVVARVLV